MLISKVDAHQNKGVRMNPKIALGWLGLFLTLAKLLLCGVVVALIFKNENGLASVGIFSLMISDIFDGVIFRKSTPEMQIRFGFTRRVLDAVGDRVCIFIVLIVMIALTGLPPYVWGVELAREVTMITIVAYSWLNKHPIREPNTASRAATLLFGLTTIAWLNSQAFLTTVLIIAVAIVGTVGLVRYYLAMNNK